VSRTVHYGWVVVGAGTLAVFACLGLGRFALGRLLPAMGESLSLTYAEMGFISSGNFGGYLAAVFAASTCARRLGYRWTIFAGLILVGVSMVMVGQAGGFIEALVLYVVTGIGSGLVNVPVMALVPHWFARRHRGRAAGYMVIGSGFAIVYSSLIVAEIDAVAGADGWRWSWLVLGVTVLAAAITCGLLIHDTPAKKGLTPFGSDAGNAPLSTHTGTAGPSPWKALAHLSAIYFLFGFTYPIYATFIVTTLVQERGFSDAVAGQFWMWLGALSLLSGVFGTLSDRFGRRAGLIVVFVLQGTAHLLVAAALPEAFLYVSIVLFGVCAWSVPSIMAAAVGDYLGPERAAAAFGTITFVFGIGQVVGPGIAGVAAEAYGGFQVSFALAAAMAATAILLTAFLKKAPD